MNASHLLILALAVGASAPAQDLRRALADADLVAVARQQGRKPVTDGVVLHRVEIVEGLRGRDRAAPTVAVLEWTKESQHNRPTLQQQRLYCLVDATRRAEQLGLPAAEGPYYKLTGWAGGNPLITGELADNAILRFARDVCAADAGASSTATAAAMARAVTAADPVVRLEAARLLAERPDLRARLAGVQWSGLVARATGEVDDIEYKIALAELCAEQRIPGLAEALVVSLDSVRQPVYACAVGRLVAHLEGDAAVPPLLRRLRENGSDKDQRAALLLALGATRTGPALDALLEFKRAQPADAAVDAALREHKSRKAVEAVLRGKDGK